MRAALVCVAAMCALASESAAQSRAEAPRADEGSWHALAVPGGRLALESLGVDPSVPRALILTELVRRLHFANEDRGRLEAAVVDIAAAAVDLSRLESAIAAASTSGKPPTVAAAQPSNSRRRFRDALEAAGLALREVSGQLHVTEDDGDDAARLRARLKKVGIDADELRRRLSGGGALAIEVASVTLPLPLSPETWRKAVFERDVPATQLFGQILGTPAARLLYHGLMAIDADTRRWFGSQPALLEELVGNADAVRAFALFAPAIRIRGGALAVPGGELGTRRWAALLETSASRADRFVERLLTRDGGRLAGLYFTLAVAGPDRQAFVLGPSSAGDDAFARLAARFVECYASELPAYPFGIRFSDPALLLLEVEVAAGGSLKGPRWRRLWAGALEGESLPEDPARDLRDRAEDGAVDAGWLVGALCAAPVEARPAIVEAFLFANRVFADVSDAALPDALVAVRARRLYPGVMTALEQARIAEPATYARIARRAEQISRVGDPRVAITALQQFQGALTLTLTAIRTQTLSPQAGSRLLDSFAAVGLEDERYGDRLAAWFAGEWLTAVAGARNPADASDTPIEALVTDALAGTSGPRSPIVWEGLTYVVDLAEDARRQLREARARQGGVTLDSVLALTRLVAELRAPALTLDGVRELGARLGGLRTQVSGFQAASEFLDDVLRVDEELDDALRDLTRIDEPRRLSRARDVADDLVPVVDFLFGHVLAAWAYAPHVGDTAQTLAGGGDLWRRHEFGVRLVERSRLTRRWEIAWRGDRGGGVSGGLFGLDAALARRTLRRMTSNTLPGEPALDANEVASMQLTASLSDPRRLTDAARDQIVAAMAAGNAAVARADEDPDVLDAAADAAALSPWRKQALSWSAAEDVKALAGWFSSTELAWIGGLRPEEIDAWGTAFLPSGCLCLRMPRLQPPEALLGRPLAAVLPHLSPGLMFRISAVLAEHGLPAALAPAVQRYAMRELIDRVRPAHGADVAAFARAIEQIDRSLIEDYISAIAAVGPLVEANERGN